MKKINSISKNKTIYLSALALAISGSMLTSAAIAETPGLNVGFDLGRAEAKKFCNNITDCDNSDTTAKVHVGYQFNPNIGMEVGYVSFGTIFKSNDSASAAYARQKANALTVSAIGSINLTELFDIYGRVGAARYDTKGSGMVQGVRVKDKDGFTPLLGAGVKFNLTENFALRGEYQVYTNISNSNRDGKKDDIQAMFAGLVFTF